MAKIPSRLAQGLSDKQLKQLESELKNSLLAKQLRAALQSKVEASSQYEESESIAMTDHFKLIGERRGYRSVLNLLPED